jgi:hypothetical protein
VLYIRYIYEVDRPPYGVSRVSLLGGFGVRTTRSQLKLLSAREELELTAVMTRSPKLVSPGRSLTAATSAAAAASAAGPPSSSRRSVSGLICLVILG